MTAASPRGQWVNDSFLGSMRCCRLWLRQKMARWAFWRPCTRPGRTTNRSDTAHPHKAHKEKQWGGGGGGGCCDMGCPAETRLNYHQASDIRYTLGNKIVDHTDVVGASPVALLQLHLHSQLNTWLQWIGQRQLQNEMRSISVLCTLY